MSAPNHRPARWALLSGAVLVTALACAPSGPESGDRSSDAAAYSVIPAPRSLMPGAGEFRVPTEVTITVSESQDELLNELARTLGEMLRVRAGSQVVVGPAALQAPAEGAAPSDPAAGAVTLVLDPTGGAPEAYDLKATPSGVSLRAATHAGLFYAIQTLRQLLVEGEDGTFSIPAVEIHDAPRFPYRGMHLDVGRHFFPVEFIKRYIDLMAQHKMNRFHWHLTEDQGWRLEIKRYPRLTEVGSCRAETMLEKNYDPFVGDGEEYCGFYTQEEAREVVEYAAARYVTVIPEIEMPGHSLAALSAYPEFACTEGPFAAATGWGIFEDIYCPTDETFAFLEGVLEEVLEIFPSRYIHIGGDEAPKRRWRESPEAQAVIRREGLADEDELQSYFIRRIERFLLERGRRLIGWDEILEGGLAPEATVMSWRGTEGGIEAARQGHDVIMTPTSHAYFDYYQGAPELEPLAIGGFLPLERVYSFEPVPEELSADEAAHVLGAQGNVWTEFMKAPERVEYMAFPRALAMAEVVWSPAETRDLADFERRLGPRLAALEAQGVNFRIPEVKGLEHDRVSLDGRFVVALESPLGAERIHYTTDGSEPTSESTGYTGPIQIAADEAGTTLTARAFLDSGRAGPLRRASFSKAEPQPPAGVDRAGLEPGLEYDYVEYEHRILSAEEVPTIEPASVGVVPEVSLEVAEREEMFGLVFSGYLEAPAAGVYTFTLTSDDGARLYIADQLVVDNDGIHGVAERAGMIALAEGLHTVTVLYFQRSRDHELELELVAMVEGAAEPLELGGRFFHAVR